MIAIKFNFKHTIYIRRETCGGMDSEPSHSEVQQTSLTIVVPADTEDYYAMAMGYVLKHSGNNRDKAFAFVGPVEKFPVNAILHFDTRLD